MKKFLLLVMTHIGVAAIGFAGGIYALPILMAPPAPDVGQVKTAASQALFKAEFRRDLEGSDLLHWGEGEVAISQSNVSLMGKLAPGPDYKLYLSPTFVETEADFIRLKDKMVRIGDVKTFNNFLLPMPRGIDPVAYNSVIVWCESFGQFISAAKYQ